MKNDAIKPQGVCAREISFGLEGRKLYDVRFSEGGPGNTGAIGKLPEGTEASKAADVLKRNPCGIRPTSCADPLARGVERVLSRVPQIQPV